MPQAPQEPLVLVGAVTRSTLSLESDVVRRVVLSIGPRPTGNLRQEFL
jgi:hypothetical protein